MNLDILCTVESQNCQKWSYMTFIGHQQSVFTDTVTTHYVTDMLVVVFQRELFMVAGVLHTTWLSTAVLFAI